MSSGARSPVVQQREQVDDPDTADAVDVPRGDLQRRAASLLPADDENNRSIIQQRLAEYEAAAEEKDRQLGVGGG